MLDGIPIAKDDLSYSTPVDTALVVSGGNHPLLENDWDPEGSSLTASIVADPDHGTISSFSSSVGTFTYTPDNSFEGFDSFTYKVNDGTSDSDVVTVAIAVGGHFGSRTNLEELPVAMAGGCAANASPVKFGDSCLTGDLEFAQMLTPGVPLIYNSGTLPQPIIILETYLQSTSDVPDEIKAKLTFNGTAGTDYSYDTTGLEAGDPLRFALQADARSLATGRYAYTVRLTARFDATNVTHDYTGHALVVNRGGSDEMFGRGWQLAGLDKLDSATGGMMLVRSTGDALWFADNGEGGYLKAPGDSSFATLVENGGGTFTLTDKHGIKANFSSAGLLTSRVDRNDNTTTFTYSSGLLTQITDPFDRDIDFTYSSDQLASVADFAGRTATLTYDGGDLDSVTQFDPDGGGPLGAPVWDFTYDCTTHLLTEVEDPLNQDTDFAYGTHERLTSITHADSTALELTALQPIGLPTGPTDNALTAANPLGNVEDERNNDWTYRTDRFGQAIEWNNPLSHKTLIQRNSVGLPIKLTEADPDGGGGPLTSPVTIFGYSSLGNLRYQKNPDNSTRTWTYDGSFNQVLTATDELSRVTEFTYDGDGNLTEVEDAADKATTFVVDALGLVTSMTTPDPDGGGALTAAVTEYEYDAYGRLETITYDDESTRVFGYDDADHVISDEDELEHIAEFLYDGLGRLTSATDRENAETTYAYDALGRLVTVTDAFDHETDYTYNNRNWVTEIERPDPDGGGSLGRPSTTYEYNAIGQVTQEGQPTMLTDVRTYAYNSAGWLTSVMGPIDETVGSTRTYDNMGRLTKETTAGLSGDYRYVKYVYNSRGGVTSAIESVLDTGFLVDGPTTTFVYDAAGQLTSTTDSRGYTTGVTYDSRGNITQITKPDPDGSGGLVSPVIQFGYDYLGRQTTVIDPLSRVTTTAFDNRNRVIKVTAPDPDGGGGLAAPETEYEYDAASRLTGLTDPLDRETNYTFDDVGRVLTITLPDPDGGGGQTRPVTTYVYNALGSVTSLTDPLGNATSYTYDTLQRQTQITEADPDAGGGQSTPVTAFTYNAQGLLSEVTDPLSHDTTFGFDNFGRRTTVTNHESKTTTTVYDEFSRVTSVTTPDPDGGGGQTASVTSYLYDRQDHVARITDPRNGQTNFTYDSLGNLLTLDDALGNTTTWTYDGLSRPIQETNELSNSRYFVYDVAGNLLRKTDRNNQVTRYTYDNLDRMLEEKWITSGTPTPTVSVATTTEGGAVNEVQRVGFNGGTFPVTGGTFTLTYSGQTTSAIAYNASAATVKSALEALSNIDADEVAVTKITDDSFVQEWRLTFQNDLGGTNVSQTTVDSSNVTGFFVSDIEATDTTGAANNEVQTVTVSNATGGTFRLTFGNEQTADIAYNASSGTVDSSLEALSSIDTVTVSGSAGGPYTVTFTGSHANTNIAQLTTDATYLTSGSVSRTITNVFDVASQLSSASDSDSSYAYTYDNIGRLLTNSNSGTSGVPTVVLTSAYNANHRRTSLSATIASTADFANSYSYDNLSRLTRVDQVGQGGGNTVADKRVDFAYNALGQFSSIVRNYKSGGNWTEVATSTYTYDTLNRLNALDHKHSSTDIANYDFTYDAMDRITQFSGPDGTSDFTYDKESQVTASNHSYQTDESNTYDATGNRTNDSYTVASNNRMSSDGTYNYTYDNEGNRITRTKISDSSLTEYTWDHRNRLTKVVERATGTGGAITKQTDYKYDVFDRRISKSYDADGAGGGSAVVSRYVYDGFNIVLQFDGSSTLTHRYLHGPAVDQILADEDATNAILWPLPDHQGTIRDLVNNSGSIQNHLKYDTFGKVTAESNSAVDHLFAYTGRERDEETGLQFHRARYYDPTVGRWISEDPIGFGGRDVNLARYVVNNPINLRDAFGLSSDPSSSELATLMITTYANSPTATGGSTGDWLDWAVRFTAPVRALATGAILNVNPVVGGAYAVYTLGQYVTSLVETGTTVYENTGHMDPMEQVYVVGGTVVADLVGVRGFSDAFSEHDAVDGHAQSPEERITDGVFGAVQLASTAVGATKMLKAPVAGAIDDLPKPGGCFVAGTPVLVAGDGTALPGTNELAESNEQLSAWSVTFAGAGIALLALRRRTRRTQRVNNPSLQVIDATNNGFDHENPQLQDLDSVLETDHLFCESTWFGSDEVEDPRVRHAGTMSIGSSEQAVLRAFKSIPCDRYQRRDDQLPWRSWRDIVAWCLLTVAMVLGLCASISHMGREHQQGLQYSASSLRADAQKGHLAAIETIRVGQRVVTGSGDDSTGVDPKTWSLLRLHAKWTWEDGTLDPIHVETLQPPEWIKQHGAVVGARVPLPLDLVEMGMADDLHAVVESVGPCPQIQSGNGRVVLTTVNRLSNDVWELTIADANGNSERVRPTGNHRFFSLDRGEWSQTRSLRTNERLKGLTEDLIVASVTELPGVHTVHNMTVEGEHVYHVSSLTAHNNGQCPGLTTPGTYFGGKTLKEALQALITKYGAPTHTPPGKYIWFDTDSGRSIIIHDQVGHGPPHVDITRRGGFPKRKIPLMEK